jgi:hypothetical protein
MFVVNKATNVFDMFPWGFNVEGIKINGVEFVTTLALSSFIAFGVYNFSIVVFIKIRATEAFTIVL